METLKVPNILPNISREEFPRSHTQIYKQTIDNPRDHDLKRRQTLWSFQHKNRGVKGKFKDIEDDTPFCSDDCETHTATEDTKDKSSKRINFPKLKQKGKTELNMTSAVEESGSVKREYSSALRISNSLYEQLRIKHNFDVKISLPKQKSLSKSLEKFPELSSSLSKLGYLKAAKNVVHYGGGFFGRNSYTDRRYVDLKRSWSTLSPTDTKSTQNELPFDKKHYGSMKQLSFAETIKVMSKNVSSENIIVTKPANEQKDTSNDMSEKMSDDKFSIEQHRQKRKIEKEKETDKILKRSKEEMIELEILSEKYSISFDKTSKEEFQNINKGEYSLDEEQERRNAEWQQQIDMMVAKRETKDEKTTDCHNDNKNNSTKNDKDKKEQTKGTQIEKVDYKIERPESDASLDIPENQFGPSSYKPDEVANRLLNSAYCINPYKWTSRKSLTDSDRDWVERAMEKTDIIDTTIYDVFARKKQKSVLKNGDRSISSSKPP